MSYRLGAIMFACAFAATLTGLPACAEESADASGWTTIEPGGETSCATGAPYEFHVKPGRGEDAEKLLVFLNGGGACWNGNQCSLDEEPTPYVPFAKIDDNDPRKAGGIFDEDNPENPLKNWTQVFAPYCTGDVHLGNRDVTYDSWKEEFTIRHRGRTNVEAVLDWVYENVKAPERIIVAGSSAGAIAAPFYGAEVANHYGDAEIIALADGAGGYRDPEIAGLIENWGFWEGAPEWVSDIDRETASFEAIDEAAAKHAPKMRVVEYDAAYDSVQEMFLRLLGNEERLYPLLQKNRDELGEKIPGFESYTARGTAHTILRDDWLYTYEEEGVRMVDWLKALADGKDVESVSCGEPETCETAPE